MSRASITASWPDRCSNYCKSARLMRMTYSDAHQAARELARARWGTQTLDRAVDVVIARSSELTSEQRAQLAEVTDQEASDE